MGLFSFLKKKKKPSPEEGEKPDAMKMDVNLPPVESANPHPSAPSTPEAPQDTSQGYPSGQSYNPPSFPSSQPEQPQAFKEAESYREENANKDIAKSIDLLSAKLDAIKVMIENLNHRLDKIEQKEKKETVRW